MFAASKNLEAGKPGTWTGYKVYLTSEGLVPFMIKFLLVSLFLFLISGLKTSWYGETKLTTKKSIFSILPWCLHWCNHTWPSHSWPTAHRPVLWKKKHTHELVQVLHEPWRRRGDFRVAHSTLLLLPKRPGQVQTSRDSAVDRLHHVKNS